MPALKLTNQLLFAYNVADGRVSRSSCVIALFFLGILYNARRLSFENRFYFTTAADLEFGTYGQPGKAPTAYLISVPAWNNSLHDSKVYKVKGYLSSKVSRYPNSASTLQISRLIISGDISENLGPTTNKLTCPEFSRTIAKKHISLMCSVFDLTHRRTACMTFLLILMNYHLLLCPKNLSTLW